MTEAFLIGLASILVMGMIAQWLAWRLRLPSILVLLTFGVLAGPVTGFLNVDALFGDLLFPIVSLSVGIILFEGSLSLKFSEIQQTRQVIRNLISVGAVVTWVISSAAAYFLLRLDLALSVLLGAILIVTGPTVIGPLLRHVRPAEPLGSILRWEGILIDPVGATLALLVFEGILIGNIEQAAGAIVVGIVKTIVVGGVLGFVGAKLLVVAMRRYWIPDYLQIPVTLMIVVAVFTLSGVLQHESGLLATTVMGVVLANQRAVAVRQIIEFKEPLGILLISSLFILLSARLEMAYLSLIGVGTLLFILVLIFIVRPATVAVSTIGSPLSSRERLFLAWMAPRGIVAASVASVFSLRLVEAGYQQAELLVPIMFAIIVVTCAVYGLTSLPLARRLGISQANPQGVLFIGAHDWAREMALALQDAGQKVLLVDTNYANLQAAQMLGLNTFYGSALSEEAQGQMDLQGIGKLLALTSNDEVNSLAALEYAHTFGRAQVYQLPLRARLNDGDDPVSRELQGRLIFSPDASFTMLGERFAEGATMKATRLTDIFTYRDYQTMYGVRALPLFLIDETGTRLSVFTLDKVLSPQPGQTIISLVTPHWSEGAPASQVSQASPERESSVSA